MSLFGSLYTAVGGLTAQSQSTAIISNNIANVNTTGFKRSEAAFASLVTVEGAAARYSPGSVNTMRLQQVGVQGQIAQSTSMTDVAISGDGFFAVKNTGNEDLAREFAFTRNGQFFEDEEGKLVNSAGMYLYGWEVDPTYSDPVATDQTSYNPDLSAVVPIDVGLPNGLAKETTMVDMAVNLDADEVPSQPNILLNPLIAGEENATTGFIDTTTSLTDYSRTIRVYDSLGKAHDITLEMRKTYAPSATAVSTTDELDLTDLTITQLGFVDGETITIDVGARGAETFTFSAATAGPPPTPETRLGDFVNFINAYDGAGGGTGGVARAYLNANGELVISANDFAAAELINLTDSGGGTVLGRIGLPFADGSAGNPELRPIYGDGALPGTLPPDNTDAIAPDDNTFPTLANLPGSTRYNADGWWQVDVVSEEFLNPINAGLINFNTDGSINAFQDNEGGIDIELVGVDWPNGDADNQDIKIEIGGFTQFSGPYNTAYSTQDGSELGLKTGVEIDGDGYVNARFSNGLLARVYKLPIVTFASPTNLAEVSATSYLESAESGEPLLQEAGVSNAGVLESAALEQSNVDLADEFTKLIVTQRAYSANTKVINTVDQMTEDLLRLR